ncbi:MAG: hypothetical protein ACLQVK_12860 [Acidimicrobiales bacterium]
MPQARRPGRAQIAPSDRLSALEILDLGAAGTALADLGSIQAERLGGILDPSLP